MKAIIIISIIVQISITFQTIAQKLESIIKLDDSKSYELYFVNSTLREKLSKSEILEDTIIDPEYQKYNPPIYFMTWKDPIITYSWKKTGLTITVDTLWNFLVDDKETIKNLKYNWKGKKVKDLPSCGFDYYVYIKEKATFINVLWLNTSCKYGGSSWGNFEFEENPLDYIKKSTRIYSAKIIFYSIEQKREILKEIKLNDKIFIHTGEYTPKFPGYFELEFQNESYNKIYDRVKKEIIQAYPDEIFDIAFVSPPPRKYRNKITTLEIDCNKTLADKFSLYKMSEEWIPNEIEILEIFFKEQSQIQWLIDKYTKE